MINIHEVVETNEMIEKENLDVRTITLGISLMDCIDSDLDKLCDNIYNKIYDTAKDLVKTGDQIAREFGIPIVNKRISVTPVSLIGGAACKSPEDFAKIAATLDKVAKAVGVNFIGGYSALVSKGMTESDRMLIESITLALSTTDVVCSSINVGSTKTGINMDAVRLMGTIVKKTAEATKALDQELARIVENCDIVATLNENKSESDSLFYEDLRPFLLKLRTMAVSAQVLLRAQAPDGRQAVSRVAFAKAWAAVEGMEQNPQYRFDVLTGLGSEISLSVRTAEPAAKSLRPFLSWLLAKYETLQ